MNKPKVFCHMVYVTALTFILEIEVSFFFFPCLLTEEMSKIQDVPLKKKKKK